MKEHGTYSTRIGGRGPGLLGAVVGGTFKLLWLMCKWMVWLLFASAYLTTMFYVHLFKGGAIGVRAYRVHLARRAHDHAPEPRTQPIPRRNVP